MTKEYFYQVVVQIPNGEYTISELIDVAKDITGLTTAELRTFVELAFVQGWFDMNDVSRNQQGELILNHNKTIVEAEPLFENINQNYNL